MKTLQSVGKRLLTFNIRIKVLMPGQSVFSQGFQKWIRIEFFYIKDTWLFPKPFHEHHGATHGWNTCRITDPLRSCFFIGCFVTAIVVDGIGLFFAVFDATNATTDGCLACVVFSKFSRIRQDSFQKLDRNNFDSLIQNRVDPGHVKMRVWERGAGETLACGTGACAVLVAGVLCGLIDPVVDIDLLGGRLRIEWNRETNHVYMTGGATTVFEGEVE